MAHAGHGYHTTTITHHDDGSATIKHDHESGDHKEYAVGDLDGVHDGMEDNLRCPEEIEQELEKRGINSEALEEAIAPGLHDKMADIMKDENGKA